MNIQVYKLAAMRPNLYLLALVASCTARSIDVADRVCNNSPLLFSFPYDQITHLNARDSRFVRDTSNRFNTFGNQCFNTTVQLDAGTRLLAAQVHIAEDRNTKSRE